VIARSGVEYTYEELSDMIDAEAVSNTAAFNVTVTSTSPTEAELIANTIAKVLPDRISEIVDGASVRIVDYAIVPAHRAGPSYVMNTVIGLLVGALLAAIVVTVQFVISEQNNVIIRSSDDLRQLYPDINVLALIPDMRLPEDKGYYYSSYYGSSKGGK
jgi:capsular polysaccharide biosynthesis protein